MNCSCFSPLNEDRVEEEEYLKPNRRLVEEKKPEIELKADPWEKVDYSRYYGFVKFAKLFAKNETETNLLVKIADPNLMPIHFCFEYSTSITVSESKDTKETIFQVQSKFTGGSEFSYKINNVPYLVMALILDNRIPHYSNEVRIIKLIIHKYAKKIEWFTAAVAEKAGRIIKESGLPFKLNLDVSENINELALTQFSPFIKQVRDLLQTVSCGTEFLPLLRGVKLDSLSICEPSHKCKLNFDDLFALEFKQIKSNMLSLNDFYERKFPQIICTETIHCEIPLTTERIGFFEKVFGNISKTFPNLKSMSHDFNITITRKDTAVDKKAQLIATNIKKNFALTPWASTVVGMFYIYFEAGNHFENVLEILKKTVPGLESKALA